LLKRFLADWLKGGLFVVVVTSTTSLLISLIAIAAKWGSFSVHIGPVTLVEYTREAGSIVFSTSFVFGQDLLLVASLGGLVYALSILYLSMRMSPLSSKRD
jgi:hypothetical protein